MADEHSAETSRPVRSRDDLLMLFYAAMKPPAAFRIGPELEKPGVYSDSRTPVPYEGERGIARVLSFLADEHGWQPYRESPTGPIIALTRGGASITLEPGGQLELSGEAAPDVHAIAVELATHMDELRPISAELGISWLGVGFHPLARRDEFEWVPKARYGIMREYLPTRGSHALDMMLRTSTVQANFDYASEADALLKMRVALALSPVVTAIFANSPWLEGRRFGGPSYRARVWLDVDPDRSGLLPCLWKRDASLLDYVEWALDAPMFVVKRGDQFFPNTSQTFRQFWQSGWSGERANVSDWKMHVNTLFPEVRLKNTIEVRGADAQAPEYAPALAALWTGILYDERALSEASELALGISYESAHEVRKVLYRDGLRSSMEGQTLTSWAERMITIAKGGLARRGRRNDAGQDESVYLAGLEALVAHGKCPADALLDKLGDRAEDASAIVGATAIR